MNENHNHDKAVEDAIERAVHGKKADGNAIVDAMAHTKPKADPAFIANLEERLMAEFSTTKTKKELAMLKRKEKPTKFGRWPLTMAAAVLAILLVGGLVLYTQQKPVETASGDSEATEASATPMPMVSVVIAVQDIPAGTMIGPDRVATIMFPADTAPRGAFTEIEAVVGYYTSTTIYMEEIVLARKLLDEAPSSGNGIAISLVVGHQNNDDAGSVCPDGRTELAVNQEVASSLSTKLESQGYSVNVLDEGGQNSSTADLTLWLHTISCDSVEISDNQFSIPQTDYAAPLAHCLVNNYGQSYADIHITANFMSTNTQDYPIMLVELDALNPEAASEAAELDAMVNSLANTVGCFFSNGSQEYSSLTPVVIALQEIPMNRVITEDMVSLVYWPHDLAARQVPENNDWYVSSLDDVIGKESTTLIPALVPIDSDWYTEPDGCAVISADCAYILPDGYVALVYHTTDLATLNYPAGSRVDVMIAMLFSQTDEPNYATLCQGCNNPGSLVMQRTITNAIVAYTELLHPNGEEEVLVTLFVRQQDSTILAWIEEAGLPYMLVPHMEGTESSVPQIQNMYGSVQAPYFVAIPIDQIDSLSYGIATGDSVSIYLAGSDLLTEGEVSYIGEAQYAPSAMQSSVEAFFQENTDVMILEVSSAQEAYDISTFVEWSRTFQVLLLNSNGASSNSSAENHYFAAIPLDQLNSIEFGTATGDKVILHLGGETSIEAEASYLGSAEYVPEPMQDGIEGINPSTTVMIAEVSSAEELAAINAFLAGDSSIVIRRQSSTGVSMESLMQGGAQWFDASALSFSVGERVDLLAQFIYLNADGEFEGMISQRLGVDMLILGMQAGEGEMAAYALVSLWEQNVPEGQMYSNFSTCCHSNAQVLVTWSLVPYNPTIGASISYYSYNDRAEPIPVDASTLTEGRFYAALPNLQLESNGGGLTVGDTVKVILENGSSIDAQISYIGSAAFAPFEMQPAMDSLREENQRVMLFEVSSVEDAAAISSAAQSQQNITIDAQQ